jgi:hypothetical protein
VKTEDKEYTITPDGGLLYDPKKMRETVKKKLIEYGVLEAEVEKLAKEEFYRF